MTRQSPPMWADAPNEHIVYHITMQNASAIARNARRRAFAAWCETLEGKKKILAQIEKTQVLDIPILKDAKRYVEDHYRKNLYLHEMGHYWEKKALEKPKERQYRMLDPKNDTRKRGDEFFSKQSKTWEKCPLSLIGSPFDINSEYRRPLSPGKNGGEAKK